jgi:hypothetical protein
MRVARRMDVHGRPTSSGDVASCEQRAVVMWPAVNNEKVESGDVVTGQQCADSEHMPAVNNAQWWGCGHWPAVNNEEW